jgi:hypothetical protein
MHAMLKADKVIGRADGTDTLYDYLALRGQALVFVAGGGHVLRNLRQARCGMGPSVSPRAPRMHAQRVA